MMLRVCVVIPTYNNPTTIEAVCEDALVTTPFPVLIVDDGSHRPVDEVLQSLMVRQARASGRLRVVRQGVNAGKGRALQIAIRDCAARGFTHMVTIDGDGQHYAREIAKVVEVAKAHPWDLVIGHRRMSGDSVPSVSKFGRKFSNFWVNYQTGTDVLDSQSGFRLYPLFHVQNMSFWTTRYDFEIEILIRLMWNGVRVHDVEIDVFYPPKEDRVSHFHKFWDNARISLLNTVFVVLALLRTHRTPGRMSAAIGLGVFIGCTPLFGLHAFIGAAAAFAFRLNAILVFIGTQVSIPPIAPFLILGSIKIGKVIWPDRGHLLPWVTGSILLGLGLGALATALSYVAFVGSRRAQMSKANWTGRSRGGRFGNGFVKAVLVLFGRRAGYFCLFFIVPYFYVFAPRGRRALNEYWTLVKPDERWARRQGRILQHFYRFGTVLMDRIVQTNSKTAAFTINRDGRDHILDPLRAGRGVILLTAHMGSWDLAASLLRDDGMREKVKVVEYAHGRAKDDLRLDSSVTSAQPVFEIHELLSAGGCVGLMGDRPMADRIELLPLLGRLAPIDVTPFRIAAATGVPLLFTIALKGEGIAYHLSAGSARVYKYDRERSRDSQLIEWATEYARFLEEKIQQAPDQWFNFFRMWSALPVLPNGAALATTPARLAEEEQAATPPRSASGLGASKTGATRFPH